MKKYLFLFLVLFTIGIVSCTKEHDGKTAVDEDIEQLLSDRNMTFADFQLPRPGDLAGIPQVDDNPITAKKIELGRSIFWDPVFNQNTFSQSNTMTASCGSCHVKDGHAGVRQGLGEGGAGTGVFGQLRDQDDVFVDALGQDFIDAQPIRVPTNTHVAYKPNALWNGALGNPKKGINNLDRENHNDGITFPDEFPFDLAAIFDGFAGPEMQGMAGLRVHRYKFNEEVITNAGSRYKTLFDEVFDQDVRTKITGGKFANSQFIDNDLFLDRGQILLNGDPAVNENTADDVWVPIQYSRLAAAMAVSAYTRSVIANEAPFQDYVYGDPNGMTEQEKRGFKVFLEAQCINCHNGPALTDADFHVMGTRDLVDIDPSLAARANNPLAGFLSDDPADIGRAAITGESTDRGAFMTQTLYNLPLTNTFFHGGENIDLTAAIDYMLNAEPVKEEFEIDELWEKQSISDNEKADLIAFIRTGLRDENFDAKYRPGVDVSNVFSCDNTAGTGNTYTPICSPNNDSRSISNDLGVICCD